MRDTQSVHEKNAPQSTDMIGKDFELLPKKRAKTVKYISAAICAITTAFVIWIGMLYWLALYRVRLKIAAFAILSFPRRPRDNTRA